MLISQNHKLPMYYVEVMQYHLRFDHTCETVEKPFFAKGLYAMLR